MAQPTELRPVAVVIMAKEPVAGRTKTRLCPPLAPDEAAGFYEAMLADRSAQVARLESVIPAVAFASLGERPAPMHLVPAGFVAVPQPEGDLGVGLEAAAAHFLAAGTPVVLVDSDSPTLPQIFLEEAVARVRDAGERDLVIGPSEDGGYHLIGMARLERSLFRGVPWSTGGVMAATLERAVAAGLAVHQLPAWWDVDVAADLDRLRRSLFQAWWPARTAAWLRRYRGAPLAPGGQSNAVTVAPPAAAAGTPSVARSERWAEPWQRIASRAVYATPWLSVREDRVRLPDGGATLYSVVECGQCVGALPFVDDDTVLLVRQYRYVAGRVTWEMPTGGVHAGERPDDAMRRELGEEAGVQAGRLEPLGAYHTSKSVMEETAHLYVARDLSPALSATSDDTEFIGVERVAFADALGMVLSGEIVDGMTIIAVLRVALAGSRLE